MSAYKSVLDQGYYSHHIDRLPSVVASCDPPILETCQVQNCDRTPDEEIFSDGELLEIIHKADEVQRKPITAGVFPSFITLHKVFLFTCVLCLLHTEGICATIANNQLPDDHQIYLDYLKKVELCPDCLRRSRNCPYCQSLNREISLEKKRENSLILDAIKLEIDHKTGNKFLSKTYPLACGGSL